MPDFWDKPCLPYPSFDHYDYRYIQQVSYFIKKMITNEELAAILLLLDDEALVALFNEFSKSANSTGQELYITLDEFNAEAKLLGLKWLIRMYEVDHRGVQRDEYIDIDSEDVDYEPSALDDCSWKSPEVGVLRKNLSTNGIPINFLGWAYGITEDLSNEEELELLRQVLLDVKTNFKKPYKIASQKILINKNGQVATQTSRVS